MTPLPTLTDAEILEYVDTRSFQRGQRYHRDGFIFDTRRQGTTLKARCHGSQGGPYYVEALFDDEGLVSTDCSCPIGGGCKHAAALLLAWRERPDAFTEVEDLDKALERRSKAELIALIRQMLRQQPDLEPLVAAPLPTSHERRGPVTPEVYRRQIAAIFHRYEDDWRGLHDLVRELTSVQAIGDGFLQQGDHAAAAAVYEALIVELLERRTEYDDGGELAGIVGRCAEELGPCLDALPEASPGRAPLLKLLFSVYQADKSLGGYGFSDAVPDLLVEHTTPEERGMIAGWVREALPQLRDWGRKACGSLLLELESETLDDEAYLRICRETGRMLDLVERLLTLNRVDEAVTEAQSLGDYPLLQAAAVFTAHHQADLAERLIQERSARSPDERLLQWLKTTRRERGDDAGVLELAEQLFRARPSLPGYQEVRELALRLGCWEALRPQLMARLEQEPFPYLRVLVYLDEGDVDAAIQAITIPQQGRYGYHGGALALEVARAAEKTRPLTALDIYRRHAERLIEHRGRDSYRTACVHLQKVRDLYTQLGQQADWATYVHGLRERFRSLRALKEELADAGL